MLNPTQQHRDRARWHKLTRGTQDFPTERARAPGGHAAVITPMRCQRRITAIGSCTARAALLAGLLAQIGLARGDDGTQDLPSTRVQSVTRDLARSRIDYERQMDQLRRQCEALFTQARIAAMKLPQGAASKLAEIDAAREAFRTRGELPALDDFQAMRRRATEASRQISRAYASASGRYAKHEAEELASAVAEEREALEGESDLVPWSDNLLSALGQQGVALAADDAGLTLALAISSPYRIEVIARAESEASMLLIDLPCTSGKRVATAADAEDTDSKDQPSGGDLRVLMSLRADTVGADLGVARPLEAQESEEVGTMLRLKAIGGPVLLASVRVKPIIAEAIEDPQGGAEKHPPRKKPTPAPRADQAERLTRGSVWDGWATDRFGKRHQIVGARVTSRDGNMFVLVAPRFIGQGEIVRTFKLDSRGRLQLGGLSARGGPATMFQLLSSSGQVSGDTLGFREVGKGSGNGDHWTFNNQFTLRRRN